MFKQASWFFMFAVLLSSFPFSTEAASVNLTTRRATSYVKVHSYAHTQPTGYSPQQIRSAYGFDQLSNDGAGQTIAIVDAYDQPTVSQDLATFNTTFGLEKMYGDTAASCTAEKGPHPCLEKRYESKKPLKNSAWAVETNLDVQWAHTIAPKADILLFEAKNESMENLLTSLRKAVASKASVISVSWGTPEFSNKNTYSKELSSSNKIIVAAAGDNGNGVSFPASLPTVLSVGGTHLNLNSQGKRTSDETAWNFSGGGLSKYISKPSFQNTVLPSKNPSTHRSIPDVSYNADPQTGFAVYTSAQSSSQNGWAEVGGTTAGAPQWAGLIALANQNRSTPLSITSANSPFYNLATTSLALSFTDIKQGKNGKCGTVCTSTSGYDSVTGFDSPLANKLVPFLLPS